MTQSGTSPLVVGLDLGGTKVEAGLVDATGRIVASQRRPTNVRRGAKGVIDDIAACVQDCLGASSATVSGLGIGVAGQVEPVTGFVRFAPNLRWRDVPLREMLSAALGMEVSVINDVQAATLGEWRHGAGKGVDDIAC